MVMLDFIARWFGKRKHPAQSRLSSDEALAIARRAAAGDPLLEYLSLVKIEQRSGNATWIVSSATVGRMLQVSIDDASGNVLEMKHIGMR
jgi:hypothetical protein